MNGRRRVLVVVGTRPEAIKLAPVVLRLQAEPESFEVTVCATGQHREMPTRAGGGGPMRMRELVATLAVLVLVLCGAYGNVVFHGCSLVYSDNHSPVEPRLVAPPGAAPLVPWSAWANRNLQQLTNFHDPAAVLFQWEPGGEFLRRGIARGTWPWWNPYVGAGVPAMANLTDQFFFPPYLLAVVLGNGSGVKNAYFLALLLLAAGCSYLLLRRHQVTRTAALAGAVAMLLCGGLTQNVGSFIGHAAACLPAALLLTRFALERPSGRRLALLAAGFAATALASFPPVLVALFGSCVVYAVALAVGSEQRGRRLACFATAGVVALALVGFAYAPAFALMHDAPQVARVYAGAGLITVPWYTLTELVSPVLVADARVSADAAMPSFGDIVLPYTGVVVLFLAGLAPAARRRQPALFWTLAILVVIFVAKLVGLEPLQSIGRLPGFDHIHFAHYLGIPLTMLLALLAALGCDALVRGEVRRRHILFAAAPLALTAAALPLVALARKAVAHPAFGYWLRHWKVLLVLLLAASALALAAATVRAELRPRLREVCVAGLVLLVAAEGIFHARYPRQTRCDVWHHPPGWLAVLENAPATRVFTAGVLEGNAPAAFELYALDSLSILNSARAFELYQRYVAPASFLFLREATQLPPDPVLDAAGIGALALASSHPDLVAAAAARGYRQTYSDEVVHLYSRSSEPRYYFSSDYRVVAAGEALAELPARRPREVLLERGPGFVASPNAAGDPPVAATVDRNRVMLHLKAPRAGLVYASEAEGRGWRATVNGREVPILAANHAFRALAVPAGEAEIVLSYRPPGLAAGVAASLAGLLALGLLATHRFPTPAPLGTAVPGLPPAVARRLLAGAAAVLLAGAAMRVATVPAAEWSKEAELVAVLRRTIGAVASGRSVTAAVEPAALELREPGFYRVGWRVKPLPNHLPAGGTANLEVTITNLGTGTWPDPATVGPLQRFGEGAVRLGWRWRGAGGEIVAESPKRVDLPGPLGPGESVTLPVVVDLPASPGSYVLQLDLVHELVTWFEQRGAARLELPVDVPPAAP